MTGTKLIIVEGIPGSGKSTTASFIKEYYDRAGIEAKLFLERNLDHPADFEFTVCFDETEYKEFISNHKREAKLLHRFTIHKGEEYFLNFMKMKNENEESFNEELLNDFRKFDIYDGLPLQKNMRLCLERWQDFAHDAQKSNCVTIFECCFIQNPVTNMLGQHNACKEDIVDFVLKIESVIKELNPVLIYYHQSDIRQTIERVSLERPKEWIGGFIEYHTQQGYGKALGLQGFDGMIEVMKVRKSIELEIFNKLSITKLMLDNSDYNWDRCNNLILETL